MGSSCPNHFYSSKHSSCAGENTGDVRVPKTDPPVCTASQQQPPFLPKSHHFASTLNTVMRRESGLPPGEQMRPKPHLGRPPRAPQPDCTGKTHLKPPVLRCIRTSTCYVQQTSELRFLTFRGKSRPKLSLHFSYSPFVLLIFKTKQP